MPIPAIAAGPAPSEWVRNVFVPVPEEWQQTFVSITGSNGEGEQIPLTGFVSRSWPAIVLQAGATGLDMPPFELHSDDSPNLDGSIYRGSRATARQVLLPVYVYGQDRRSMVAFKRKLAAALNPKNGPCILMFVESDGVPRYLQCYYAGGMDGDESADMAGFHWSTYGLQLTAMDPWWYGDSAVSQSWNFGAELPMLGGAGPFLPLTLAEGTWASNTVTLTNDGDIEAWPIWTITGPLQSLTVTGPDGSCWELPPLPGGSPVLASGRTLTVDTRPGYKSLLDDQGTNYYRLLAPAPALWPVPPGTSTATILADAGSGTPSVSMSLNPRYASY